MLAKALLAASLVFTAPACAFPQDKPALLFDAHHNHAQNEPLGVLHERSYKMFDSLLQKNHGASLGKHQSSLTAAALHGKTALVVLSPNQAYSSDETAAVLGFLEGGGSLLLFFDEERRTPLTTGVNQFIEPYGMRLTANAPVRHNCGALAVNWDVCSQAWELPYSGGRSVEGGKAISLVYDKGSHVHCAFTETGKGGKIIVMAEAMAGLLLGEPDGIRFSGSGPTDSKYWGKDSLRFMEEVFAFLLQ